MPHLGFLLGTPNPLGTGALILTLTLNQLSKTRLSFLPTDFRDTASLPTWPHPMKRAASHSCWDSQSVRLLVRLSARKCTSGGVISSGCALTSGFPVCSRHAVVLPTWPSGSLIRWRAVQGEVWLELWVDRLSAQGLPMKPQVLQPSRGPHGAGGDVRSQGCGEK